MVIFLIAQSQGIELEEEVKAKRTKFYTLDGQIGLWASDKQYYRGELGIQMQYDLGIYGRLSFISFDRFYGFALPSLKEAFVELSFDNSLDIKGGLGALFWGNGLLLGDYLGGNPFVEVSYGKSVWFGFLIANTPYTAFGGLRVAFDIKQFGFEFYGIADTGKTPYGGLVFEMDYPFWYLSLEGVASRDTAFGIYLTNTFNFGRFRFGINGFSTTKNYQRIVGQGLVFDRDWSPFMGFSTHLTYTSPSIPWTYISGRSGEFIRLSFLYPINEDWTFKPSFDLGMYQTIPLSIEKHNYPFADAHIRFDWTENMYMGLSAGALIDSTVYWRVAGYVSSTFGF
ncbi:MAG: hypothetical protein ABIL16_04930 [candidate division WOR-3 bacterium]